MVQHALQVTSLLSGFRRGSPIIFGESAAVVALVDRDKTCDSAAAAAAAAAFSSSCIFLARIFFRWH